MVNFPFCDGRSNGTPPLRTESSSTVYKITTKIGTQKLKPNSRNLPSSEPEQAAAARPTAPHHSTSPRRLTMTRTQTRITNDKGTPIQKSTPKAVVAMVVKLPSPAIKIKIKISPSE